MAKDVWTRSTPWFGPDKKTAAVWPTWVCRRSGCPSRGLSHPNCKCGAPSFSQQSKNLEYAHGGEIRFCDGDQSHNPSCEYYATGGQITENNELFDNPNLAVDHAVAQHGLLHALTKTGHSKSENAHKPTEEFIDHSRRGRRLMHSHAGSHFDPKHQNVEPQGHEVAALRKHLDDVRENPNSLLDTGGSLGLSDHAAMLSAKAATAVDYFEALKPKQPQPGPLDSRLPVSKIHDQSYNRQLGIAERPLSILGHVRNGTVQPADIQTLTTLYPQLFKSIQEKTFESLVDAKTAGREIPYKQKIGLSMLLGQPLDATMTQSAMQAIMTANAGAKTESQGQPPQAHSAVSTATQKAMAKVDDLYKTPLEKIQTGK